MRSENLSTDGYIIIILGHARSPLRDFESYFRIVVGLDEEDIRLILKQYNAHFVTYELSPGIYTIKILRKLFIPLAIIKELLKLNMMTIPLKLNLF